jgi:hypothetical protein
MSDALLLLAAVYSFVLGVLFGLLWGVPRWREYRAVQALRRDLRVWEDLDYTQRHDR